MFSVNNLIHLVHKSCVSTLRRQLSSKSGAASGGLISSRSSDSLQFKRTHYCGTLTAQNVGERVSVCGWVQATRYQNFLVVRDIKGHVQVCVDNDAPSDNDLRDLVARLSQESVVRVCGLVRKRPPGQENVKMSTGAIEIKCEHIEVLSRAKDKLPFEIAELHRPGEAVRLKYRYLDLRFKDLQQNLIMRSNFVHRVRQHLNERNFIDIETPTLFRRTPGGAREFLVPTNKSGEFYCLTQSPQQFKQLLMIAGFDRYYQIARCYRDENARIDRQPEFTQIDLEMSFVNENDVIYAVEDLIERCWPLEIGTPKPPFQRMSYHEAMSQYGTDKPDIRFDMKINDLSEHLKGDSTGSNKIDAVQKDDKFCALGIRIPSTCLDPKQIEKEYVNILEGTFFKSAHAHTKNSFTFLTMTNKSGNQISKHVKDEVKRRIRQQLECKDENDQVVVLVSTNRDKALEILGKLRLNLADMIDSQSKNGLLLRDPSVYKFLWVVDFPLFTRNEETNKLESTHHPFTAPHSAHVAQLLAGEQLDSILGLHYDLVLNGNEIAGGSIRVHDARLQRHILTRVLGEETSTLEHLLDALECGAPPHGGIAFGLDRLVAILVGARNIRDVIAFPKNQSGRDMMAAAPSQVTKEELDYYRISCLSDNQ